MVGRVREFYWWLLFAILHGCESLKLAREEDPYCGLSGLLRDPFGAEDSLNGVLAHCDKETSPRKMSKSRQKPEPPPHKQVLWVHLHKMGGTFVGHEAERQGERLPDDNINGDWMPDFCSTKKNKRILCEHRVHWYPWVTWSHIERELDADDFCDQTILGTMLRDPLASMASCLSFDKFKKAAIFSFLRDGEGTIPHARKGWMRKYGDPACLPRWDTYQHFDNFATRVLGHAYEVPPGEIGQVHLNIAKQNLRRFSTVLILEELQTHLPQLNNAFGWDLHIESGKRYNSHGAGHNVSGLFDTEEVAFLQRLNAIDYELYAFAKELANQMTRDALRNLNQTDHT